MKKKAARLLALMLTLALLLSAVPARAELSPELMAALRTPVTGGAGLQTAAFERVVTVVVEDDVLGLTTATGLTASVSTGLAGTTGFTVYDSLGTATFFPLISGNNTLTDTGAAFFGSGLGLWGLENYGNLGAAGSTKLCGDAARQALAQALNVSTNLSWDQLRDELNNLHGTLKTADPETVTLPAGYANSDMTKAEALKAYVKALKGIDNSLIAYMHTHTVTIPGPNYGKTSFTPENEYCFSLAEIRSLYGPRNAVRSMAAAMDFTVVRGEVAVARFDCSSCSGGDFDDPNSPCRQCP